MNAYDGKVNLLWNKSIADDFDRYNVYISASEIVDVTGMVPTQIIRDISTTNYQISGLKDGSRQYFAITAVDKVGNENKRVTSVSAIPTLMPAGAIDTDLSMSIYDPVLAWPGTTLLSDNHNPERPRIIEVNMRGEIIWEYLVPQRLRQYTNPGFDVELLSNNNILFVLPRNGVYEIDRSGKVVWSYLTDKISHDADRLPDGNTLFVWGEDQKGDAQVREINQKGEVVWTWYAKDHFDKPPYKDIYDSGWLHTNAVTRLPDGNTLISPRNFNFIIEVDTIGSVVRTIGEGLLVSQHDPEVLPNGNILLANQGRPHRAMEIHPTGRQLIWQSPPFELTATPVRDANRLPNGNTLITASTKIVEVTSSGKIVWQLSIKDANWGGDRLLSPARGFYKADRISAQK